jgi:hypothetical protein
MNLKLQSKSIRKLLLGVVDDFRAFDWVGRIEFSNLVLNESEVLYRDEQFEEV